MHHRIHRTLQRCSTIQIAQINRHIEQALEATNHLRFLGQAEEDHQVEEELATANIVLPLGKELPTVRKVSRRNTTNGVGGGST